MSYRANVPKNWKKAQFDKGPTDGRRNNRPKTPPPVEHQFKKGFDPKRNPGHKLKGGQSIGNHIRRILEEEAPGTDGKTLGEMVARVLVGKSLSGSLGHITEVCDRTEGKAKQTHEVKVETSQAIIQRTEAASKAAKLSRKRREQQRQE